MIANPDAAIDLLAKKEPLINKDIEKQRLIYVTKTLIATPEAAELGVGDAKDARMAEIDRYHRRFLRAAAQAGGRGCRSVAHSCRRRQSACSARRAIDPSLLLGEPGSAMR